MSNALVLDLECREVEVEPILWLAAWLSNWRTSCRGQPHVSMVGRGRCAGVSVDWTVTVRGSRAPCGWRLVVYEADRSPPGYDGAIYQPNTPDEIEKDLVFPSPLVSSLLLRTVIEDRTVSAHFHGKSNG